MCLACLPWFADVCVPSNSPGQVLSRPGLAQRQNLGDLDCKILKVKRRKTTLTISNQHPTVYRSTGLRCLFFPLLVFTLVTSLWASWGLHGLREYHLTNLGGHRSQARSLAPSPDRTAFPVTPERPELAVQPLGGRGRRDRPGRIVRGDVLIQQEDSGRW